jgi:K+/H+ antiporter YhaU regulatory subunit KhtT
MKKIKEYLDKRLKTLDYELVYFEDDDGNNLLSAKRVKKEITEVKDLLALFRVSISFKEKLKTTIEELEIDKFKRINELKVQGKQDKSFYDLELNIIQTKILTLKSVINDC